MGLNVYTAFWFAYSKYDTWPMFNFRAEYVSFLVQQPQQIHHNKILQWNNKALQKLLENDETTCMTITENTIHM